MKQLFFCFLLFVTSSSMGQDRTGLDHAVFFAVNDYQKMGQLKNPVTNAKDIAAILENRYGFAIEVIANPTLVHIERKITQLKRDYARGNLARKGQLLIFFSGHGVMKGSNGYFMPTDADPLRPHVSAVEYDYWRDEINTIDCQHIMVIIDACHSITFDPNWVNKTDRRFIRPGEQFSDQVLSNHQSYRSRLFLTSDARGNQTPDRSNFALKLQEGLRFHQSSTNYLTSSELYGSYLKMATPTPGGGTFGDNDLGSVFLFFQRQAEDLTNPRLEREVWKKARESNSAAAFRQYLYKYPNGDFASIAKQKLSKLEKEERELRDWQKTKKLNNQKAYQDFAEAYPNSLYREVATLRVEELQVQKKTSTANTSNLVRSGNFMSTRALVGDGIYSILRRYGLDRHSCNFDKFYDLNKLKRNSPLVPGRQYLLPILVYQFNGKTIRSSIGINDWDIAISIQSFNEEMLKQQIRMKSFQQDRELWVPFYLLNCPSESKN